MGLAAKGELGGYAGQPEGLRPVVYHGDAGGQRLVAGVGGFEWVGHYEGGLAGRGYCGVGRFGVALVVEDATAGGRFGG